LGTRETDTFWTLDHVKGYYGGMKKQQKTRFYHLMNLFVIFAHSRQ